MPQTYCGTLNILKVFALGNDVRLLYPFLQRQNASL